ncbi:hypothetical protein HNY73_012620 [Argiope bruennichi]|uniref:Uncharacterized protein n=1 Tax=Argiope bruennichi TaxID=94029 RepID=A0A8T0EX68_ARGBR|nr:hypothetical protein HNY73_012620 [Argiope bruennichi]
MSDLERELRISIDKAMQCDRREPPTEPVIAMSPKRFAQLVGLLRHDLNPPVCDKGRHYPPFRLEDPSTWTFCVFGSCKKQSQEYWYDTGKQHTYVPPPPGWKDDAAQGSQSAPVKEIFVPLSKPKPGAGGGGGGGGGANQRQQLNPNSGEVQIFEGGRNLNPFQSHQHHPHGGQTQGFVKNGPGSFAGSSGNQRIPGSSLKGSQKNSRPGSHAHKYWHDEGKQHTYIPPPPDWKEDIHQGSKYNNVPPVKEILVPLNKLQPGEGAPLNPNQRQQFLPNRGAIQILEGGLPVNPFQSQQYHPHGGQIQGSTNNGQGGYPFQSQQYPLQGGQIQKSVNIGQAGNPFQYQQHSPHIQESGNTVRVGHPLQSQQHHPNQGGQIQGGSKEQVGHPFHYQQHPPHIGPIQESANNGQVGQSFQPQQHSALVGNIQESADNGQAGQSFQPQQHSALVGNIQESWGNPFNLNNILHLLGIFKKVLVMDKLDSLFNPKSVIHMVGRFKKVLVMDKLDSLFNPKSVKQNGGKIQESASKGQVGQSFQSQERHPHGGQIQGNANNEQVEHSVQSQQHLSQDGQIQESAKNGKGGHSFQSQQNPSNGGQIQANVNNGQVAHPFQSQQHHPQGEPIQGSVIRDSETSVMSNKNQIVSDSSLESARGDSGPNDQDSGGNRKEDITDENKKATEKMTEAPSSSVSLFGKKYVLCSVLFILNNRYQYILNI